MCNFVSENYGCDGFPAACATVFGVAAGPGGKSVNSVIYRELLCSSLYLDVPLGFIQTLRFPVGCYSASLTTMMPGSRGGKPKQISSREQMEIGLKLMCRRFFGFLVFFLVNAVPNKSTL